MREETRHPNFMVPKISEQDYLSLADALIDVKHSHQIRLKTAKCAIEVYDATTNIYIGSYASQTEASRILHVPTGKISEVVSKKRKTAGGYIFTKAL